jgi:hypothetical protein
VPAEVRNAMTFVLVERIDDAIEAALLPTKVDSTAVDPDLNPIHDRPEIEFSPVSALSN